MDYKSVEYKIKFPKISPIDSPSQPVIISSIGNSLELSLKCINCNSEISFSINQLHETPKINASISLSLKDKYIDLEVLKKIQAIYPNLKFSKDEPCHLYWPSQDQHYYPLHMHKTCQNCSHKVGVLFSIDQDGRDFYPYRSFRLFDSAMIPETLSIPVSKTWGEF